MPPTVSDQRLRVDVRRQGWHRSNETEETGAERVGENDIVLARTLGAMKKNRGIFRQEGCFSLDKSLMGDPIAPLRSDFITGYIF